MIPWGNAYYNTSQCGRQDNETWSTGYNKKAKECWISNCQKDIKSCYDGTVICQHGSNECVVDKIEMCAIAHNPDPRIYFPFIYCFEGLHPASQTTTFDEIVQAAKRCSKISSRIQFHKVMDCFSGHEGLMLEKINAKKTFSLQPEHLYTPWVVLNGEPILFPDGDDDTLPNPLDNLLKWVCGNYTGTVLPAGCQ